MFEYLKILWNIIRDALIIETGEIRHEDYSANQYLTWPVNTDCSNGVAIFATIDLEKDRDILTIAYDENNPTYSGNDEIYITTLSQNFTLYFSSDYSISNTGFVLNWACDLTSLVDSLDYNPDDSFKDIFESLLDSFTDLLDILNTLDISLDNYTK